MDFNETLAGLAVFGTLLAVAIVQDRRPYTPGRLNWVPPMMIGLVGTLLFAAHLATLLKS